MMTTTKALLALGAAGLAAGTFVSTNLIKPPFSASLYVLLPVGAIFFGLFLVSRMLEKESVFFDKEHEAAVTTAKQKLESQKGGDAVRPVPPQ